MLQKLIDWLVARLPVALRPRTILAVHERASRWRVVRAAHLRKEPACAACGRSVDVVAHHVIPVSFDESRELDPENLLTLCDYPCHIVFGHLMNFHCYNKDVRKMVAEYRRAVNKRKCLPPTERFHSAS
jgi:hypothetical protein